MNRTRKKVERDENPYNSANFVSKWTFWWVRHLFKKGLKRPLEEHEIYQHRQNLDSAQLTDQLNILWQEELKKKDPSILRILFRAYGPTFITLGLLICVVESATRIAQPLCLGKLVAYFADKQSEISKDEAYLYAGGIVICSLLPVMTFHPFIFQIFQIGTKMRLACAGLIYRKTLRISKAALNDGLSGRVINILSSDLGKFDLALAFFHDLWKGPTEALLLGYFMYREIGISAIVGVAFMLSFIPLQAWAAKKAAYYRQLTAERTDLRVKLMNEIIQGIQVIKMYAWEKSFASIIEKVRKKELHAIRGTIYIYAALHTTVMISKFSIFLSLISYAFLGDVITAQKIFTVSSFFNVLNDSMVHFWPLAITFCAEAYISTKRVRDYLLEDEGKESNQITSEDAVQSKLNSDQIPEIKFSDKLTIDINGAKKEIHQQRSYRKIYPKAKTKSLVIEKVTAYWGDTESGENIAIRNLSLIVNEGKMAAIVGPVGAGKSSLFNVILGELQKNIGDITINGTLSYAPQEPWLFEGTLRDNIVFIEDFDEQRYKEVVHVCALERDIELLPFGDMTIVGERGVSLSGGQKARVNLARAVYKKADIYLMDDPLSAVDTHVGKHIFELCIQQFLSGNIRVLITHQLQYLQNVEHLVLMKAGSIEAQGSYRELKKLDDFQFLSQSHDESGDPEVKANKISVEKSSKDFLENETNDEEERKELQAIGSVKLDVYKSYFKSLDSSIVLCLLFALFIIVRVMLTGVDYFISRWAIWEENVYTITQQNSTNLSESAADTSFIFAPYSDSIAGQRENIIIVYTVFLFITFILYIARTYGFFATCLRISLHLHNKLFRGITCTAMLFFNTNPSGRILNRFSKDIHTVDGVLSEALIDCISFFVDITGVLVIVAVANYWLLIPAFIVASLFYLLRALYINTSRSIKRIESISRSPIFSHTNQTFQGLTTIRAMQAEQPLEKEFHDHQNANTAAWFVFLASNRAFALWLDVVCVLYIFAVTFSFLAFDDQFESGDVGLAIMQCITMVGMCQWGMRQTAELENHMTSVERIFEYAEQPAEGSLETVEKFKPSADWPNLGKIEFTKLSLRYSNNDDYVLKDLNFTIHSKEKIGIVGRTGAGKSSIISALFRLAFNEGIIKVDEVDISNLGLHTLRAKISIIPQDPILFSGTLRHNLDPFEQKTDSDMWKVLEDVELKPYVSSLVGGLNCKMSDGGSNFSMGQRQLVCLARAILRNNKILILDEATANVDPETDNLIQRTIRDKFTDCTVLTIAHRLHTVMDNDRILVMDAGRVVEFDQPHQLLKKEHGFLRKLVDQTGAETAKVLFDNAEQSFKTRRKDT